MRVFLCLKLIPKKKAVMMQNFKTEAAKLIKNHLAELNQAADELGGVFITGSNGAVAVIGAENSKKKIIFTTSFVIS